MEMVKIGNSNHELLSKRLYSFYLESNSQVKIYSYNHFTANKISSTRYNVIERAEKRIGLKN